jgi:predicted aldo/keto reductase-like oxidoreductase
MMVSALGMGMMRLPTRGDRTDSPEILQDQVDAMVRTAIERGVNYFDTGYGYHGGQSEVATGKALAGGLRDKVYLVTKSPVWLINAPGDFERLLDEQLRKLQTDHVDVYLMHGLSGSRLHDKIERFNLCAQAEKAKQAGKIGHIGFSFHDEYPAFEQIMAAYDGWEVAQIQYNYAQPDFQAGRRGLALAATRGMAVVAMEPLYAGRLANVEPELLAGHAGRSACQWALDWVWNQPEVSLALSGMHSLAQVEEDCALADQAEVGNLSPEQIEFLAALGKRLTSGGEIPCTKCSYCMPCPQGVNIPRNLELYNDMLTYGREIASRDYHRMAVFAGEAAMAQTCIACHECEEKCPQGIPISTWMGEIAQTLE